MRWLVVLLMGSAAPTESTPRRVRLDYGVDASAPACPGEPTFRDAVTARLGYEPFAEISPTSVTVRFSRDEVGFRATVTVESAGNAAGEKLLTSAASDCAELAATTSLAVSIVIDPLSPMRAPLAAAPAAVAPPPPPAPTPPRPAPPPEATPVGVDLAGGPSVGFGHTPAVSVGAIIEGRVRWRRFSLGLDVRPELPASTAWGAGALRTALVSFSLAPCLHVGPGEVCGVVLGGVMRTDGDGFTMPGSATTPHVLAGLRLGARLQLSERWALRAQGELMVRAVRVTLTVGEQVAWSSPILAGTLGLVAVATFK